jgi:hypothetical protein
MTFEEKCSHGVLGVGLNGLGKYPDAPFCSHCVFEKINEIEKEICNYFSSNSGFYGFHVTDTKKRNKEKKKRQKEKMK